MAANAFIETRPNTMYLSRIRVDWSRNTRTRDDVAIQTYAASIRKVGVVIPVVIDLVDDDPEFDAELVAGFHRYEAARLAECIDIPYVLRSEAGREEAHAVENIARSGLWPLEEARGIEGLLASGYTPQGAAEVLAKSTQWVTARQPLLDLPEQLRAPWGPHTSVLGGWPQLSVAKRLRALHDIAPWAAQRLVDLAMLPEPTDDWQAPQNPLLSLSTDGRGGDGGAARSAICHQPPKGAFAASIGGGYAGASIDGDDVRKLATTKRAKALADRLDAALAIANKGRDQYGYGYVNGAKLNDQDLDTLNALGVLFVLSAENTSSWYSAVCFDRDAWLEAVEAATARLEADNEERKQQQAQQATSGKSDEELTPKQQGERALRLMQRELAGPDSAARAANHELFAALYGGGSIVDDGVQLDVARLFVEQWLGGRDLKFTDEGKLNASSNYMAGNISERIHLVARVKLAVPELSRVETPTRKDGKPGKAKVVYATDKDTWTWILRYLDGASTSVQLFDRAIKLMIIGQQTIAHAASAGRSAQPFAVALSCKEAEKPLAALTKGRLPKALATVKGALTRAYKAAGSGLDSRV